MRVWITRAEPGAAATAKALAARGHDPFVHPLLTVRPTGATPDLDGVDALAFTSANGVRAFADASNVRYLTVFAVGDATAEAAGAAGFANIRSAAGDVRALAALITAARPRRVLHAAAAEPAGDLVGDLAAAGVEARSIALYQTSPMAPPDRLPPLDALLIHSPRAGRLAAAVDQARGLIAICISAAAAAPLIAAGFARVTTAPFPNEPAMLKLLDLEGR